MNAHSVKLPLRVCQSLQAPRLSVPRRRLHLAPPFLLDDYIPRYQTLSSRDAALKRSKAYAHLRNCNLCPRLCGVNRYETTGMCLIGDKAKVNVIGECAPSVHAFLA
jgi:putative pyruvate formate lyase activating enzyme